MIEMSRFGRVPRLLSTDQALWESPLESLELSTLFFEGGGRRGGSVCVKGREGRGERKILLARNREMRISHAGDLDAEQRPD